MEGYRPVERDVDYYNLDVIISVGYRVNSLRGTQFRRWASQVLKEYLVKGYALNQKNLNEHSIKQLQHTIEILSKTLIQQRLVTDVGSQVLEIIHKYSKTWDTLFRYDENRLEEPQKEMPIIEFTYKEAVKGIVSLSKELSEKGEATQLFGQERGEALEAILGNVMQTFDQKPYTDHTMRAAHLLYFVIKDHPFSDGNNTHWMPTVSYVSQENSHRYNTG